MTRHSLTRRQAWRIQKIHQERRQRLERSAQSGEELARSGHLGHEQEGLVIANHGANLQVEDRAGGLHHCVPRRHLELPVSGDRVVWQEAPDATGVVVAVLPRHSLLGRPDATGRLRPIAANIDQIIVVTAPRPPLQEDLLDRYLVAAETLGIAPVLLVNKADLLQGELAAEIGQRMAVYRSIGYPVRLASSRTSHGLDDLGAQLRGHVSVLVGQSGVGKSSIINRLIPQREVPVAELSRTTGLGRHTTSATTLYHLPGGGDLIDSPGVRDMRPWRASPAEVAWGFREFRPFLGKCRFRDCRHEGDAGCALQEAVDRGAIVARRLDSYLRIAESLATKTGAPPGDAQ